jgi:hypothetical protein
MIVWNRRTCAGQVGRSTMISKRTTHRESITAVSLGGLALLNRADRDIGGLVLVDDLLHVADGNFRRAAHHAVLGAMELLLQ